jgi:hypothetical protein
VLLVYPDLVVCKVDHCRTRRGEEGEKEKRRFLSPLFFPFSLSSQFCVSDKKLSDSSGQRKTPPVFYGT